MPGADLTDSSWDVSEGRASVIDAGRASVILLSMLGSSLGDSSDGELACAGATGFAASATGAATDLRVSVTGASVGLVVSVVSGMSSASGPPGTSVSVGSVAAGLRESNLD